MSEIVTGATSQSLRWSNASAVLRILRSRGDATASDLVAATGLSRPTVHTVCGELIELGWVEELAPIRPQGANRPGRSARRYRFRTGAASVIGIDIGAHKLAVVVADLVGETLAEVRHDYRDPLIPAEERLAAVRSAVAETLAAAGVAPEQVATTVVGVPGPVDQERGSTTAHETFLPGMSGLDLRTCLDAPDHWIVEVENDCNLAALGEQWRGVAAGADDLVVLLAGERLGAGIMMDGRLVRGNIGAAGEMSYLFLLDGVGNVDGIALAARQLGERAVAAGWSPPADGPVEARAVFAAAEAGDPVAIDLVDELGERFGLVAASLTLLLDPELLVFAGAVAEAGPIFLPPIRAHVGEAIERMSAPPLSTHPRIEASTLGDHVVVTGAIRLALDVVSRRCLGGDGAAIPPAPGRTAPIAD